MNLGTSINMFAFGRGIKTPRPFVDQLRDTCRVGFRTLDIDFYEAAHRGMIKDDLNCADWEEKIEAVVRKIYGGNGVSFLPAAKKQLATLTDLGFGNCPVCMAKTQYSFSDDPTKIGAPENFTVTIKNVRVSAGAGFVVILTGDIMTMPGLPKVPAAEKIDVDDNGKISGLF